MRAFDRKFGPEFMASIPTGPGVYQVFSASDELIYIGKAKNLRRRLSQYRNAKRRKKHLKMRQIVADAVRIEHVCCESELEAELLETRLIQKHRPRWNVAGAFYFLYPMLGYERQGDVTHFCYTHEPAAYPSHRFFGAYRSRYITCQAYFSLLELLAFVADPLPGRRTFRGANRSYCFGFRRIPEGWLDQLDAFWKGESRQAVEDLVLALVDSRLARRQKRSTQDRLLDLKRFWAHEATALRLICKKTGYGGYPVPQAERDLLFLLSRRAHFRAKVQGREDRPICAL